MHKRRRFFFHKARAADWVRRGMRVPFILASVACSLAWADGSELPQKKPAGRKLGLSIQVQGGGWGRGRKESIETVLNAVADTLMARLPPGRSRRPSSSPTPTARRWRCMGGAARRVPHPPARPRRQLAPVCLRVRPRAVPRAVQLRRPAGHHRDNQWFEEALCETASLFTLRHLAQRWEAQPPGPEWVGEAARLRGFFELLIGEGHRMLPADAPLAAWLRDNEDGLRRDPYLRQKNEVLANLLLPLFEHDPDNWQALAYLNLDPADARSSLRAYLSRWYASTPPAHRRWWPGAGPAGPRRRGAAVAPARPAAGVGRLIRRVR
jgi:hypothetical protein